MGVLKVILILTVIKSSIADDGGLLKPCEIKDMDCLSETTQNFLEQTSAGIPNYDIKPIDPIIFTEFDFEVPEFNLVFHFKNLSLVGLKHQKISDFKMDKDTKSVVLQTRVDEAKIVSDVSIELKSAAKSFSGVYYATTTVVGTAEYNYQLIPNKEGVEFFEVGPEKITCEVIGTPEVSVDAEQAKIIADDPDAKAVKEEYYKKATEIRKRLMLKLFDEAYATVIHNIRASAKVFPKTAFFKDI